MRFKEFLQLELDGLFGNIKTASGNLGIIQSQIKDCQTVKGKGTSVGRMMSSGPKVTTPARPAGLNSHKKPMTIPSLLK